MGIIYIGSFLVLWASVLLFKKNNKQENMMIWIVISFMLTLCIQAFTCGVIGLLGISITLLSAGILNVISSAVLIWRICRKGVQQYQFHIIDLIAVLLISFLTWRFALYHYTPTLNINFVSTDASTHALFARSVAVEHCLPTNMYFSALPTGLMMSAWSSLTGMEPGEYYKVFICCEVVYLALSGLMLWATIRENCGEGWIRHIVPLLVAPVYWIAYPANSTIFGFSYFGMSICILSLLVFLLKKWFDEKESRFWIIVGLNLALYGIFVCYTLFVPVAFLGTFVSLGLEMIRRDKKKLINKRNILTCISIFLVPTVLGMIYSFNNLEALNPAPGNAGIHTDGGCYADMYSNFIPLIPFALIGVYFVLKRDRWNYILPITAIQLIITVVFFLGVWTGKVSAYYYMKNNNLIWMLLWILTAEGILGMAEHCKAAVLFPLFFYGLLFMGLMGDFRISLKNERMIRMDSSSVFDIVFFDKAFYEASYYQVRDEGYELYQYVNQHCDADERVICLGPDIETVWFRPCTGHTDIFIYGNLDNFLEMKGDVKYICAMYSNVYDACKSYLDTLEPVFENSAGRILRVN